MTRPDDIPEDVWMAAESADLKCNRDACQDASCNGFLCANALRAAILAERERCAKIADAYAEVNWTSVTDSILLDPVLSNKGELPLTDADFARSEDMIVDGTIHSSMYHAATNIAAAIRNTPNKPPLG